MRNDWQKHEKGISFGVAAGLSLGLLATSVLSASLWGVLIWAVIVLYAVIFLVVAEREK